MNNKYLAMIIALTFIVFGCKKDDNDGLPETGDPIELSGTQDVPLTLENRFENPNVADYIVTGNWTLNAAVTVEPGVRIEVVSSGKITVRSEGSFNAVGTAQLPIIITGVTQTKGFWDYLWFQDSNYPDNKLIHTHISYGGGNSLNSYNTTVLLNGNSQVTMQHSSVKHSAKIGLRLSAKGARLPEFQNNEFDHNEMHPISLHGLRQLADFDGSNDFVGSNGYNSVYVAGSTVESAITIQDVNGPINLHGNTNIESNVTIEPGAYFSMGSNMRLSVRSDGSLNAIGTASNPITITGAAEAKGYWDYIYFQNSNNPLNEFQFTNISYGGGNSLNAYNATIVLGSGTLFKMGNSSVTNSQRYGFKISANATFVNDGNNTFSGNEAGDFE